MDNFLDQMNQDHETWKDQKLKNILDIENTAQETLTSANDEDLEDDDLNTKTVTPNDALIDEFSFFFAKIGPTGKIFVGT